MEQHLQQQQQQQLRPSSWSEAAALLRDPSTQVRVRLLGFGFTSGGHCSFEFAVQSRFLGGALQQQLQLQQKQGQQQQQILQMQLQQRLGLGAEVLVAPSSSTSPSSSSSYGCSCMMVEWRVVRRFSAFSVLHKRVAGAWGRRREELPALPNARPVIFGHSASFLRNRAVDLAAFAQALLDCARTEIFKETIASSSKTSSQSKNNDKRHSACDLIFAFFLPDDEKASSTLQNYTNMSPPSPSGDVGLDLSDDFHLKGSNNAPGALGNLSRVSTPSIFPSSASTSPISSTLSPSLSRKGIGLKDFSFIRVIGKGSFGKVLLAESLGNARGLGYNSLVAVKALRIGDMVERHQADRVLLERRCLELCDSPFIVKLRCAFRNSTHVFLVQDYCAGGELYYLLDRNGILSSDHARFIVSECVLGLESMHKLGIAFRDLKPENIMFDAEGHIKLVDFGLAKEGIFSSIAGSRSFVGTTEYLPPEMILRRGHGTGVDWWALGMVLYEMLTGLPPFFVEDRQLLMERILSRPLTFPTTIPDDAQVLLKGLLRRDPRHRLGAITDAEEIKRQSYFSDLDWKAVFEKRIQPPRRPRLASAIDTRYFDPTFTNLPPVVVDEEDLMIEESNNNNNCGESKKGNNNVSLFDNVWNDQVEFTGEDLFDLDPFDSFPLDGQGVGLW